MDSSSRDHAHASSYLWKPFEKVPYAWFIVRERAGVDLEYAASSEGAVVVFGNEADAQIWADGLNELAAKNPTQ